MLGRLNDWFFASELEETREIRAMLEGRLEELTGEYCDVITQKRRLIEERDAAWKTADQSLADSAWAHDEMAELRRKLDAAEAQHRDDRMEIEALRSRVSSREFAEVSSEREACLCDVRCRA